MPPTGNERFDRLVGEVEANRRRVKLTGIPEPVQRVGFDREVNFDASLQLTEMETCEIAVCEKCPLLLRGERYGFRAVPGFGNVRAELMVIGDYPGEEEAKPARERVFGRFGLPFVGRSGAVVDKVISYLGYTRRDVWLTNALKCRSLDSAGDFTARPAGQFLRACNSYLRREIERVRPWIILAMGGKAAQVLLRMGAGEDADSGDDSLSWLVAHNPHRLPDPSPGCEYTKVWATYNPAFILRSPGQVVALTEELSKVRAAIRLAKGEIPREAAAW